MFSSSLANNLYQQTGQYYTFEAEGKGIRGAISSFESGLEEIGSVTGYGQPTAVVDDDTIIVTIPVTCENGTGSIELIFSNDIYFVMSSCTFNLNESMGELMVRAALNTLIGMGTVFVVLILIIIHRKPHFRAACGEFVCRAYIKYCTIFSCNKQMK